MLPVATNYIVPIIMAGIMALTGFSQPIIKKEVKQEVSMSTEMKKELNRTGYIYRKEMIDGTVTTDSSVSSELIEHINKDNVKSIHVVDAVTGRLVDKWER